MTTWGQFILTDVVPMGVLCVELPYFRYDKFWSGGGYLWLSDSYTVAVVRLWAVFQIVYSCTGSYTGLICKMND